MLRPPSLSKTFDMYYSGDPAFEQAPKPPGDDASDDDRKAYIEAMKVYQQKLKVARDTGDWSALRKPDMVPSKFVMQQIHRPTWRAVQDRAALDENSSRHLGLNQVVAVAFRLAVTSIPDLGLDLKHAPDRDLDGWKMAPESVIDTLDQIDVGIVGELGLLLVAKMSEGIRPLA